MRKKIVLLALLIMVLLSFSACSDYVGYWNIVEVNAGDVTMTGEDIKDMGLSAGHIRLNKSGSCEVNLLGDEYEGTWEVDDEEGDIDIHYGDGFWGEASRDGKQLVFVDFQSSTYRLEKF